MTTASSYTISCKKTKNFSISKAVKGNKERGKARIIKSISVLYTKKRGHYKI